MNDHEALRAAIERRLEHSTEPMTVGQVAKALGVQPWTVRRLEKRGVIPAPRRSLVNRERIYEPATLDELLRRIVHARVRPAR